MANRLPAAQIDSTLAQVAHVLRFRPLPPGVTLADHLHALAEETERIKRAQDHRRLRDALHAVAVGLHTMTAGYARRHGPAVVTTHLRVRQEVSRAARYAGLTRRGGQRP